MKYTDFINLRYKPNNEDLLVLFKITPTKGFTIKEAACRIASESSNGTWTDLKVPEHIEKLKAKVYDINGNWVKVAYPNELFEKGNMPQVLSSIAGNIFGMKAIDGLRLEDIQWPKNILKSFRGPQFGIEGVRKFMKIKKRPLLATVPKPKVGYYPEEHAKVGYDAWTGGLDLLKDDENLTSQSFNKFEARLKASMKMRDKAEKETGERKSYLLNITAGYDEMVRRAKLAKEYGNEYIMVDIMTAGWSAVQSIREVAQDLKLAIHAHRAFHAAFDRNPNHGMSMQVVAEIARMQGVDNMHIGGMGKLVGNKDEVYHNFAKIEMDHSEKFKNTFGQNWYGMNKSWAVCSGGLHPGIIGRLMDLLGTDLILQAGGGIHGHPRGTHYGAIAFRQAIDAYLEKVPISKYAKKHNELKEALDMWKHKTFE